MNIQYRKVLCVCCDVCVLIIDMIEYYYVLSVSECIVFDHIFKPKR